MLLNNLRMNVDPITFKIIISFGLLVVGFTIAKVIEKVIVILLRRKFKVTLKRPLLAKIAFYGIVIFSIILALGILQINLSMGTFFTLYAYTPKIISTVLLFILISLFIQFIFFIITNFINKSGVSYLIENYGKGNILEAGLSIFKIILYIIGILIILNIVGFDVKGTTSFLSYVTYPILLLFLLLLFVGIKDLAKNIIAGYYFKYVQLVRKGEFLKVNNEKVKIKDFTPTGIIAETKDHFQVLIPFKEIMDKGISFKKIKTELSSLSKIRNSFIAQHPSYCGPASASMILKVFGYDISQDEIGRLAHTIVPKHGPGGTKPRDIIRIIEKLTKGKVIGVWIDTDKIVDLKNEIKSWLYGEALIIIDYKKSYIFPSAKKAHYSVCLSVNGNELLVLDPSSNTGGVYYVDYRRVYAGMETYSELIGGKRGYIVLALDGTPAYQQIKEGMVYADISLEKKITKRIQKKIINVYKKMFSLEKVMPKRVKNFMNKANKNEKIARIWKPKQ